MRTLHIFSLIAVLFTMAGCEELSSIAGNSHESGSSNPGAPNCDVCRSDETLQLRWLAEGSNIIGYKIYYSSEPYISERVLMTLDASSDNFDLLDPAVSYHAWNDLSLYKGDNVCFRILSFTLSGGENLSQEACGQLPDDSTTVQARNGVLNEPQAG